MKVAVCVATYRRPEGLRRLLEGLERLTFEKVAPPVVEVIVADNDPDVSGRKICEELRNRLHWRLKYCVEPRRGISHARNKAMSCAPEDADFLAFLDDDEVPELVWLDELLHVQKRYAADVVGGPVLVRFEERVPEWVKRGRFFEQAFDHPRFATGHMLELTAAGNVLFSARIPQKAGIWFDERFSLTGGEDVYFFAQIRRAGYRMVWADEALVYEWTPASRTNVPWLLKRAYRLGTTLSLLEKRFEPTLWVRLLRAAKASGRIAQGLAVMTSAPFVGKHALIKGLQYVCRGTGMLAGMVGIGYQEYR